MFWRHENECWSMVFPVRQKFVSKLNKTLLFLPSFFMSWTQRSVLCTSGKLQMKTSFFSKHHWSPPASSTRTDQCETVQTWKRLRCWVHISLLRFNTKGNTDTWWPMTAHQKWVICLFFLFVCCCFFKEMYCKWLLVVDYFGGPFLSFCAERPAT